MRFKAGTLVLLCVAAFSVPSLAQQPTATVTGMVQDPSGAGIPGASVTITNKAQQFTLRLSTSGAGIYNAPGLLPGFYEVGVEAKGFKKQVIELSVEVGRVVPADVRLQVGDVTETVTVKENGVHVNPAQTALEGILTSSPRLKPGDSYGSKHDLPPE